MRTAAEGLAPTVGLTAACRALGVARASVYRHRKPPVSAPQRPRRPSPRALAPQERTQVVDTLHSGGESRRCSSDSVQTWARSG